MAKVIIENEKKKTVRPDTTQSTMYISFRGELCEGHYLKANRNTSRRLIP